MTAMCFFCLWKNNMKNVVHTGLSLSPTRPRSHHAHHDLELIQIVVRSRYERHDFFRCFHDDTTLLQRPATIIPRSHNAFLRLSWSYYAHHVLPTTIPWVIRLQHDLTTLLLRLKRVLITIILLSYRDLTTFSAITSTSVFHINTGLFLLFLINT